jgi:hypothetical protein
MKISRLAGVAALLAAGFAQAQEVKLNAIVEEWYVQMLDSNLRLNSAPTAAQGGGYLTAPSLDTVWKENQFSHRRTEIYLNGKMTDKLTWGVMFDPNNSTSSVGNNILNDAWVNYQFTPRFSLKGGQFKPLQTWEASMVGTAGFMFYQRSLGSRLVGDRRDRGVVATMGFGDAKGFNGKFNLGIFNGTSDDGSAGKNADSNAQKDVAARLEMGYGSDHKFGAYYRDGVTSVKDVNLVAGTTTAWGPSAPSATQIKDNKDRTTNMGAYYVYETSKWQASAEVITGLLGRRNPTVFAAATAVGRQHLDQKYMAYTFSGVYKMGNHQITARYDFLNYNSGDDWYTATNPYVYSYTPAGGTASTVDVSPKFTEMIVGYNYVFNPAKFSFAKFKLNYIHRSDNFLLPIAGQSGEQGGNSVVASIMVGF